ncbi:MAG: hypothetical protein HOK86_00235 [Micrococcales bacterium]|nr:hypothetical protein [Micrococcales bacterium]MBT7926013.1 hypothetical protein [Micrococcales bacterium]
MDLRHPGGIGAIVSICGTNSTSIFQGKHGGLSGPASSLSAYLLGDVGSWSSAGYVTTPE